MRQIAIVLLLIAAGCTDEPARIENRGSGAPRWADALPRPELVRMAAAFDAIIDGTVSYDVADGVREYRFDGFSVLAPNGGN